MTSLTHAPIPSWSNLFQSVTNNNVLDSELARPWLRNNDTGYWFSRSAWSLYTIVKFKMHVTGRDNICVWLPDYFCNASITLIRKLGVRLRFYPILENGNPNIEVCNDMNKNNKPDIIVAVHYFGEPGFTKELYDFSLKNLAWLIEDAAHVLNPVQGVGEYGDFVLYSPHKFLPIPDGGLMIIRSNGPNNITNKFLKKYNFFGLYDSVINNDKGINLISYKWIIKRTLQKIGFRAKYRGVDFFEITSVFESDFIYPSKMSTAAKKILFSLTSNLNNESNNRKKIKSDWISSLIRNKILDDDIQAFDSKCTPYLAGFCGPDSGNIENAYNMLAGCKIPVTTWPDLPPEVISNPVKHRVAIQLRKTRFFLPVHNSVNVNSIKLVNMKF